VLLQLLGCLGTEPLRAVVLLLLPEESHLLKSGCGQDSEMPVVQPRTQADPVTLRLPTNNNNHVRFEVFTAVTMKNGVFWVVMPCGSCSCWFSQEPHGVTPQKTPFNINHATQ
jgi:hypothetical protein